MRGTKSKIWSGWCESGHCVKCPELLQEANDKKPELHCGHSCHK